MEINDFDCNALCDLGANISGITKALYDILELKRMNKCHLNLQLVDSTIKKPL